jgi:hypothetical protein
VIREFEIIGEATKYLLKNKLIDKQYQIVVDLRNQITHEYFGIDEDIVWAVIHYDMDDLEEIILRIISGIEENLKTELIDSFVEDNRHLDFVVKSLIKIHNSKFNIV